MFYHDGSTLWGPVSWTRCHSQPTTLTFGNTRQPSGHRGLCYHDSAMPTLGILTSSDLGARGQREDTSGQRIRELLASAGFEVLCYEVVPDEQADLEERLRRWADEGSLDLIVTTGGTGLTSRDVTPEATRAVVDREVPGMAEAMRIQTLKHTPFAMISRAVVGVRGRTLIINLPGSLKAVQECLEVVLPAIPHALEMLRENPPAHEA